MPLYLNSTDRYARNNYCWAHALRGDRIGHMKNPRPSPPDDALPGTVILHGARIIAIGLVGVHET